MFPNKNTNFYFILISISKTNTNTSSSYDTKTNTWNYWFAGLVDGDGCFCINKKNQISFELTTDITDSRIVYNLKHILKGGSVKLRSGSKSVRYRVKKCAIICDIVARLNGKLQNPNRLKQLQKICQQLNICYQSSPKIISPNNSYLSGLIDSDATISISVSYASQENSQKVGIMGKCIRLQNSRGFNQIYLKITSIHKSNLVFIEQSYKIGKICQEKTHKSPNIKYNWVLSSEKQFQFIYAYLKKYPLQSVKMHRIRLALLYFYYKKFKYDLKHPQTVEYKIWLKFCKSWFKYSI